ncbi:MAG: hypothetical protein J6S77_04560 [Clostridia bacterium]|nr:hypothetical protein [Clostridia bacterium]
MKKILSIFMITMCVCTLFVLNATAARDPLAEKFEEDLLVLDHFYNFDYDYMIRIASDQFVNWDEDGPFTATAEEFDGVLRKYFAITDKQIQELREYGNRDYNNEIYDEETWEVIEVIPFFNEATQIYTFRFYGGFGGTLPPRQYLGYVKNGETYDVYFQHLTYVYLEDYLPEGVDENELIEGWPEYVEYDGLRFEGGPEGYAAILSYDNYGRKYTVELNGDVVRIIACVDYTESQLPEAFDDKEVPDVIYDIPADITIPQNDCFDGNTIVKVEKIKAGGTLEIVDKAMQSIAEKYVAFEFTATKDNATVQPNGKLAVTFDIPQGYSNNVTVFYMDKNGSLERLETTVNTSNKTATAELAHFSVYILADEDSAEHEHNYETVVIAPTCAAEGYTTYTCECGDTYTDDKTKAIDHSFGEWAETQTGKETRQCKNCDFSETRSTDSSSPDREESKPETNSSVIISDNTDDEGDSGNTVIIIIAIAVAVIAATVVAFVIIGKKKAK